MAESPPQQPPSPPPAGGFLPSTGLLSPAPSSLVSRTTAGGGLPHPRARALRAGSLKEEKVRRYVEERLLYISRRYVKKFGQPAPGDDVVGYKSMRELCRDVQGLIDILWRSGSPRLQIPYLLNIALELTDWVTTFAPSPRATFGVLRKLDYCFASLLGGEDMDTHEALPGFENGPRAGMSLTDMVRCKSIVEQMRVVIVGVMNMGGAEGDDDDDDEDEDDLAAEEHAWDEDDDDDTHMDVARVYEHTIVKLGEVLAGGGGIGDIGDVAEVDEVDEY